VDTETIQTHRGVCDHLSGGKKVEFEFVKPCLTGTFSAKTVETFSKQNDANLRCANRLLSAPISNLEHLPQHALESFGKWRYTPHLLALPLKPGLRPESPVSPIILARQEMFLEK
jgi:hypothetical protein